MRICSNGGAFNFFIRRIRSGISNVCLYGVIEKKGILEHHGYLLTKGMEFDTFDIMTVNIDIPFCGIVKSGNQFCEGGLTTTTGTNHRNHLARSSSYVDIGKNFSVLIIHEVDMPEFYDSIYLW